ncbi:hypothetical protein BLA29_002103 [Euroglyphus maynei]|uniref:Uncharacterized protein n=1 Tax=Euroglyphus maynei TaxID=6958 RepID=A0A1Y3BBI6_EURMA|nr:hypothetical protein BLA29_002103 [Euroglyphus maynei]
MQFQCEYVRLRLKYLQAHKHFRQCCQMIQSSPCPISLISNGNQMAQSANCWSDDLLRNGRIVTSLQKCSHEFRRISDNYSSLYQSSFDADPNTLSYIQLCQHSCTLLAEVIENLFQKSHRIDSLFLRSNRAISPVNQIRTINTNDSTSASIIEQKEMENVCTLISNLVQKNELMSLTNVDQSQRTNGRQFLSLFSRQIEMLLRISARMLLVPLSFPRFFFQAIQSTNIKLELSSQPARNIQDTINIGQSVQFVLYVEGVVITNHSKLKLSSTKSTLMSMSDHRLTMQSMMRMIHKADKPLGGQNIRTNIFRKVNKILLTLNAVPINNANDLSHMTPMSQSTITMHSIVVPVNDYFHTQFLLSFPNINLYNISVETSIIDENEAQWKSGPIQTITAKVVEDYKAI